MPEADGIATIWHPNATDACSSDIMALGNVIDIQAKSVDEAVNAARTAIGEGAVFRRKRPV
jgi:hypothetical protein